jgi:hypothetical protein
MKTFIMLIMFLSIYILVSRADYNDEISYQAHYCKMAAAGHWPEREYCE